jgi:threonine synthase
MKLQIRFFATLRDRAGIDSTSIELPATSTVSTLVEVLSNQFPGLKLALPSALIAVNHEYAFPDSPLNDGDEVAIFPPVSGGSGPHEWPEYFAVTKDKLDVDAIIKLITRPETGAVAVFAGAVRGATNKPGMPEITSHLFYEAYEPMAEKMLRQVAAEIRERYPKVQGIAAVQRLGHLNVGETTILVACSSGHRNDGIFEAAHYGINRVKEIVPVWKKEVGPVGEVWIEGDYHPTPSDVSSEHPEDFIMGCAACGERYPLVTSQHLCKCGAPLEFIQTPAFDLTKIDTAVTSMWRYRAMLAPNAVVPISLDEGWTPLVEFPTESARVLAKLESLNPSGSFKDRGMALLISVLHANGITQVHDDSSGNAGASLAMFAARGGIQARLFVPSTASPIKLAQIELYGASLELIEGPRSASTDAAIAYADNSYYASHVYHPLPMLGYKSTGWEIWEQLGRLVPDVVIVPVGQGSQLIGIFNGFKDLHAAKLISKLPRMIGVQAANCAPIWHQAYDRTAVAEHKTIAEGIRVLNPIRSDAVVAAIRATQGEIVAVSEDEIIDGFTQLARRGIFVEPTSAVVWGALKKIEGSISKDDTIVLIMSGSGLKSSNLDQLTHLVSS